MGNLTTNADTYISDLFGICKRDCISCSDTVYDYIIDVDDMANDLADSYGKFCHALATNVKAELYDGAYVQAIADFTGFVKENKEAFRKLVPEIFADAYVDSMLEDDDELCYQYLIFFDNAFVGNYGFKAYTKYLTMFREAGIFKRGSQDLFEGKKKKKIVHKPYEMKEEENPYAWDMRLEKKALAKQFPNLDDDAITIKAASHVANKFRVSRKDVLCTFKPTGSGQKTWAEDGKVASMNKIEESVSNGQMATNEDAFNDSNYFPLTRELLPSTGDGDTKATQASTALWKLVYKWFNDGDIFDNTSGYMEGFANDISGSANWLYNNIEETRDILNRIFKIKTEDEYTAMLIDLANVVEAAVPRLMNEPKVGSAYNDEGPFVWEEKYYCDICGDEISHEEYRSNGGCCSYCEDEDDYDSFDEE